MINEQLTLDIRLRSDWNFSNFHVSENQQLIASLKNIRNEYSIFYIWGELASGKTHLLNALCHGFKEQYPESSLVYLPLGEEYELASNCLEGLESCDLVCVDNVDAVLGQEHWEAALFHFINRMKDHGRVLVFSSAQALGELSIKLPDLKSRLSEALNFELKTLKDNDLILVLKAKANERGIKLEDGVLAYIAKRGPRNMSTLIHLLDTLDKQSLKQKRLITIPFVKSLVDW